MAVLFPRQSLTFAWLAGCLVCWPFTAANAQVDWANKTAAKTLDIDGNWQSGVLPTPAQVIRFASASFVASPLELQHDNLSVAGILLDVEAGALLFSSSGEGVGKTLSVGASGIVNLSSSTLTFDITTKVNLALSASASFKANGPIVIIDDGGQHITTGLAIGASTLTLEGTSTGSSIERAFTGTGGVVKTDTGTWALIGANTYTGGTTISGGMLNINNTSGSGVGSGAVTVQSGGTLGGSGSIGGATTIADGGYLAPGNSPGTLTFTKGLTLATGAVLDFQLGTVSDLIAVTGGTLTGASGITLNLSNSGGFAPSVSYTLFNFLSGQTSSFDVADFTFGPLIGTTVASDYSFNLTATSLSLTYNGSASAIPEPSAYAVLAGAALLGFAAWRCRRARTQVAHR